MMSDADESSEYQEQLDQLSGLVSLDTSIPLETVNRLLHGLRLSNVTQVQLRGSTLPSRLTDMNIIRLVSALSTSNVPLELLDLSFNRITDSGFEEICRLLQPSIFNSDSQREGYTMNPTLTVLRLEGNDITGDIIDKTCLISRFDCQLRELDLSSNELSVKGQENVSFILQNNEALRILRVHRCGFTMQGMVHITSRLRENHSLLELGIDRPLLQTVSVGGEQHKHHVTAMCANLLDSRSVLTSLSMRQHTMTDNGARLIADSLFLRPKLSQRLLTLNLESNRIGVAGAEALASALIQNGAQSLQSLGLAYNCVADDGAIALAEAIASNCALRHLTLRNNRIAHKGLVALAQTLENCRELETLTIFENEFQNETGRVFHELCQNTLPYKNLRLDVTVYVVDGLYQIAEQ